MEKINISLSPEKAELYLNPGFRPEGWEIMGVVNQGCNTGALMQSPSGRLMMGNASACRSLPHREANAAMLEAMGIR